MISTLESIARFYIGHPVVVEIRPAWPSMGWASYGPGGVPLIVIDYDLGGQLPRIFFHEVAHHALGHIARPGEGLFPSPARMTELRTIYPDCEALASLQELIDATIDAAEQAAWVWADQQLAEFERQFGPFLDAIR